MQLREINDAGLDEITSGEQFRAVAYDDKQPKRTKYATTSDVIGVPTIGWGHTRTVTKLDVVRGETIDEATGRQLLRMDLADAYRKIAACVKPEAIAALNDNQYAALVSFVFNCGLVSTWKIVALLNAGRLDEVPGQLERFVYDDGVRVQGLVNRRRKEIDLWHTPVPAPVTVIQTTMIPTPAPPVNLPAPSIVLPAPTPSLVAMPAPAPVPVTVPMGPAPVSAAPIAHPMTSRTFKASLVAGLSGVGTAVSAGIATLAPFANDGLLKSVMVGLVLTATAASFLAAFFKASDLKGEGA